jgi:hypothetical protein
MRTFYVADLTAAGELRAVVPYRYEELEQIPAAPELIGSFSSFLWREPQGFSATLPGSLVHARWAPSSDTSGVLTVRCAGNVPAAAAAAERAGALASLSLLATGINAPADRITFDAFQKHLLRQLRDSGFEPAFDLMALAQRPIVVTVNFQAPSREADQLLVALADRCFAAAYFRFHQLA